MLGAERIVIFAKVVVFLDCEEDIFPSLVLALVADLAVRPEPQILLGVGLPLVGREEGFGRTEKEGQVSGGPGLCWRWFEGCGRRTEICS